jgi:hypothetical protein
MTDTTPTKQCRKCKIIKGDNEFHRHARTSDGLTTWCKSCRSESRTKKDYAVSVDEKLCTKCELVKPSAEFSPSRQNKSGLASWCKSCHRERCRALKYGANTSISEKSCTVCAMAKSIDQFNRNRQSKSGYQSRCKSCQKAEHREWYVRNSENIIARTKQWAAENPEKAKAAASRGQRRRRYGLTAAEYDAFVLSQGGKCASCLEDFGDSTPHVDHDHVTGVVRELLCGSCNKTLGMAQESRDRLLGLVRYLERHERVRTIA